MLQNAPRCSDSLERLLKLEEIQKEEAMPIETHKKVVAEEIKMLNVVSNLIAMSRRTKKRTMLYNL